MVVVIVPMLPGLANKVTPKRVKIPADLTHLFAINWLYGFISACILYYTFNLIWKDEKTLIPATIHGDVQIVEGQESSNHRRVDQGEKELKRNESVEIGQPRTS
jgi:NCS1 family nucleobase:cation symporter-1